MWKYEFCLVELILNFFSFLQPLFSKDFSTVFLRSDCTVHKMLKPPPVTSLKSILFHRIHTYGHPSFSLKIFRLLLYPEGSSPWETSALKWAPASHCLCTSWLRRRMPGWRGCPGCGSPVTVSGHQNVLCRTSAIHWRWKRWKVQRNRWNRTVPVGVSRTRSPSLGWRVVVVVAAGRWSCSRKVVQTG